MQAANVVLRNQAIQANKPSGGGGGGGGGGEEPGCIFYIVVLSAVAAIGGLVFGIIGVTQDSGDLFTSANGTIALIVSGVSCGVLGITCAIIYQDRLFALFDDPPSTGAQTGSSELDASAPGELPLLAVVPVTATGPIHV